MKNLLNNTCCFTGHRPKSLPWGYNEKGNEYKQFIKRLKDALNTLINEGVGLFISGMAQGFDIIAAETIIELKKKHPTIKLECAIPCLNQHVGWSKGYKERYKKVLEQADSVTYVSQCNYFTGCMRKRNRYMIEKSTHLIALYNGTKGGTAQTIEFANKKNVAIIIINA